ncbi:FAD-dependent oxidoreductase [Streptomyces varsoviensis]|nr:FAD-dependent oxidoreductase [Streptomyces varsoviensis]
MHDVTIVGAGPVGLFLACELGLAGCSVLVLERDAEPRSPWKADPLGNRGLTAASMEAFHRRGLLRPLRTASGVDEAPGDGRGTDLDPPPPPRTARRFAGHFAGMMLDPAAIDDAALPFRLPGPAAQGMMTRLEAVEAVLSERAARLGVRIRRGAPVSAISQDDEGVTVRAGERDYAARWLVGCDGGRSTVRGLAGFAFTGTEPQFTGYVMLATIADPGQLRPGFHLTPTGMYIRAFTEGYVAMLDCDGGAFDRSRQPTREHLQAVLRRISGTDVTLSDIQLASTFTDRAMQATDYRRGRVLLAGDAAHIHSPLGGQGLNLGLGDAMNLGWKLAATVRGDAPDGLLDTYARERLPVGAEVLDWTRAQAVSMRPDPHGQAIQGVLRDLLRTRDGTTYAYQRISGYSHRYDLGGDHPLVGRDVPDLRLEDGTRVGDLMRDGRAVVLDFSAGHALHDSAMGWKSRLRYVAGSARNELGVAAVFVRPDGAVAWVGEHDPGHEDFERAAGRWLGAPDN